MSQLMAFLPSLTRCASISKEDELLLKGKTRSSFARNDSEGVNIYLCGPDMTIAFIYSVSPQDLHAVLPALALNLEL